jgi:hypothetical protein
MTRIQFCISNSILNIKTRTVMQEIISSILTNYIHKILNNDDIILEVRLTDTGSDCFHMEMRENKKEVSFIGLVYFPSADSYTYDKVGVRIVSEHFGINSEVSFFIQSKHFTFEEKEEWQVVSAKCITDILTEIRGLYHSCDDASLNMRQAKEYGFQIRNFNNSIQLYEDLDTKLDMEDLYKMPIRDLFNLLRNIV